MGIKRFSISVTLSLLMLSAAYAQEIKKDTIGGNNEKIDSVQILYDELAQVKSELGVMETERRYEKIWKRKKYIKIGYEIPDIERTDGDAMAWDTEYAFSFQWGKTAYFHSKPLWGMVKFGLDYGFMNVSYAKLKLKTIETSNTSSSPSTGSGTVSNGGFDEIVSDDPSGSILSLMGLDLGLHKIDYGLHVGPSLSVNPWKHLIVSAYFHAMPTSSFILENDQFSYGFGCAMSAGVSVAYKALSLGVEGVWSTIKYKQASFEEDDYDDEGNTSIFNTEEFKLKQKSPRFYIAFRF